jgi:hypothetical protein
MSQQIPRCANNVVSRVGWQSNCLCSIRHGAYSRDCFALHQAAITTRVARDTTACHTAGLACESSSCWVCMPSRLRLAAGTTVGEVTCEMQNQIRVLLPGTLLHVAAHAVSV